MKYCVKYVDLNQFMKEKDKKNLKFWTINKRRSGDKFKMIFVFGGTDVEKGDKK